MPRPNVESVLVEINRRQPPDISPEQLFSLVRTAFGQRRKMLRRSLRERVTAEHFARAGVEPTDRPEDVDLDGWVRLADVVGP